MVVQSGIEPASSDYQPDARPLATEPYGGDGVRRTGVLGRSLLFAEVPQRLCKITLICGSLNVGVRRCSRRSASNCNTDCNTEPTPRWRRSTSSNHVRSRRSPLDSTAMDRTSFARDQRHGSVVGLSLRERGKGQTAGSRHDCRATAQRGARSG